MEVIDLRTYYHNIKMALENYRGLTAFCENAVDNVTWEINGIKVPTKLLCNAERVLTTADIKVHMDRMLGMYEDACRLKKNERRYNIIRFKFLDWPGTGSLKQFPYSNEELAIYFDCSTDTIQRELKLAYEELKTYFFGPDRIKTAK